MPVNSNLAYILFLSSPMPSLQMLISTGHRKVQNNTVNASQVWVKQQQSIFCHYYLDHVSPGHTPVYVLSFPCVPVLLLMIIWGGGQWEWWLFCCYYWVGMWRLYNPGPVGEVSVFKVAFPLTTVRYYTVIYMVRVGLGLVWIHYTIWMVTYVVNGLLTL